MLISIKGTSTPAGIKADVSRLIDPHNDSTAHMRAAAEHVKAAASMLMRKEPVPDAQTDVEVFSVAAWSSVAGDLNRGEPVFKPMSFASQMTAIQALFNTVSYLYGFADATDKLKGNT